MNKSKKKKQSPPSKSVRPKKIVRPAAVASVADDERAEQAANASAIDALSTDPALRSGGKAIAQTLRGMRDILPAEQKYWAHLYEVVTSIACAYGFERIDTPLLEETILFTRSAGKQTDVVEKELFSFLDKGNDNVSLRPEGTASLVRAYIMHGMLNQPQPVKLFYWGSMFRYERPQQGRYREHHQFGFETFGDALPVTDAEIVYLAQLFYKDLGIKTVAQMNSLGCATCRQTYLAELTLYYRSKRSQICEDCKRRLLKSPLRLLDCKTPECQPVKEAAPSIIDFLDEECKNHFMRVLEILDDLQVAYELNPYLVRGFDYYTRTVFELVATVPGEHGAIALGGGGRYDLLVEQLGGRPTPACGFGIGLERAVLQMRAEQIEPPDHSKPDLFLAQLGDAARRHAFILFEDLRHVGIHVAANFSKNGLKGQLEMANRLGARYTLIIGQQEVLDGTILIRDMESGMQEVVDNTRVVTEMKKKLEKMLLA